MTTRRVTVLQSDGTQSSEPDLLVRPVGGEVVRPLRALVLRPGKPISALVYPGDDHSETVHFAAIREGEVIGIASIYLEPPPADVEGEIPVDAYLPGASFRLRGMAAHPDAQRAGVGAAVLAACLRHAEVRGARFMWCNARTSAIGFYERFGFRTAGEEFTMQEFGQHFVMWKSL